MIKISAMTGKLDGLKAINTSPLNNPYCQRMSKCKEFICAYCYSIDMLKGYRRNCIPAWTKNGEELSKPIPFWHLPKFKSGTVVRFSGHGELFNTVHAINLIKIAYRNPTSKFSLFTKRARLVQNAVDILGKPANLQLVFSSPKLNKQSPLPKYFDRTFTVWEESYRTDHHDIHAPINCGARKCIECMICYEDNGVSAVNELLK